MKTRFEEKENKFYFYFEGHLDTPAAAEISQDIEVLNDCDGRDVILDCNQLEYIASSGMRLFLTILKNCKKKGSQVYVTGMNSMIQQVFGLTGLLDCFKQI